MLVSIDERRAG